MEFQKEVKTYGAGGLHVTLSSKEFKAGDVVVVLKEDTYKTMTETIADHEDRLQEFEERLQELEQLAGY